MYKKKGLKNVQALVKHLFFFYPRHLSYCQTNIFLCISGISTIIGLLERLTLQQCQHDRQILCRLFYLSHAEHASGNNTLQGLFVSAEPN